MKKYAPYIKWIFMILGASRFRMFGAFAGFFIGLYIENFIVNGVGSFSMGDDESNNSIQFTPYQNNLLILIAAILRSNHSISKEQSFFILKYFFKQFDTRNGKALYGKLKTVLKSNVDLQSATNFMAVTTNREQKIKLMTFLFGIAFIDKVLLTNEKVILENIAKAIGLSQNDFERIISEAKQKKKQTFNNGTRYVSVSTHYKVLGVTRNATESELKKAYRKLVLTYHPDRTKFEPKIAAQKFQQVQEAYDVIREEKGYK